MAKILKANVYQINDSKSSIDFKKDFITDSDIFKNTHAVATIFFEKPIIKGRKVKELLTGVEFDTMYLAQRIDFHPAYDEGFGFISIYKSKNNNPTTIVSLSDFYCREVSSSDLIDYVNEHRDIAKYKNQLENIKYKGFKLGKKEVINNFHELSHSEKRKVLCKIKRNRKSYR